MNNKLAVLMILLAASCKTASSSSSQSSSDTQTNTATNEKQTTDETSQTTTTKTIEQDPSKTTTTENEYELVPVPVAPGEPPKPPVPVLKHQRVKVEERGKKTASIDIQKQQEAKISLEESLRQQVLDHQKRSEEDELTSTPSVGCAMAGWMWAFIITIGALGLITGLLKLAGKKIPFVG